jgi:glycosyltransferase involved in cell wall biosynthesis
MSVAIFTNNYRPRISGVSVAVDFADRALRLHGHQTIIIAPDYGFDPEVPGAQVHRVKSFSYQKLKIAVALQELQQQRILGIVEGFQPDVIHSHHPFLLGDAAARAADEFSIPMVYTFHTLYDFFAHYFKLDFSAVRRRVREFVRAYTDQCDLVIAPTEPIRGYLGEIGVTSRTATVPTGIEAARFEQVTDQTVGGLRQLYRLERFEEVLLSVGRVSKEKNIQLCLATLGELARRGRNCCLLLLGDGPDSDSLAKEAKELGLGDRLILGGFLDQASVAAAYSLGSVFLFPSDSDTQGIVLYEACTVGLPIVAVDSMASRAILRDGHNGLFAAPTAADFADQVERILSNPDRFREPLPLEPYSMQTIGQTYGTLYGQVAEQGRSAVRTKRMRFRDLADEVRNLAKNSKNSQPRRAKRMKRSRQKRL